MTNWKDIEFGDVSQGMSTNVVNPGQKTAKRILNLQNHIKPGALILRPGYEELYAKPECTILDSLEDPVILDMGFINFDLFFDRQAVADGMEIICSIQKARVHSIVNTEEIQNMLCFWVRPYWTGTSWVDEWKWINETVISKIVTGSDATYPNMIIVSGGTANGITDDSLSGFTIYNQTKSQYARVITSKVVDTTTRICHTLYDSAWEVDDVVIIGRNFIEFQYMNELYSVNWKDITFHKILNDLRIGFGGYENRPGLMVGYRKKHALIKTFDFTNLHTDLDSDEDGIIDTEILEEFVKTDEIVLDTHILISNAYGIELISVAGDLTAGTYYFRLTGLIDNYEEQLIAESSIAVDGTESITVYPYISIGKDSPRITRFKLYKSTDNITFYKINEYGIREDEYSVSSALWKVNEQSRLYLDDAIEIHSESNAASVDDETNSLGTWIKSNPDWGTALLEVDLDGAGGSDYSIKFGWGGAPYSGAVVGVKFPIDGLRNNTNYNITLYLKADLSGGGIYRNIYLNFADDNTSNFATGVIQSVDGVFTQYSITLNTGDLPGGAKYLVIRHVHNVGEFFWIDNVSIDGSNVLVVDQASVQTTEMKAELGYTPTYNLVKGWDQALSFWGRTYYLNPYVDKRYENFILVSHIHSNSSYMYSIASFSNFRELEKFDSNEAIGMALLPTMELLILKDGSVVPIDPDTGAAREPIYGVSCISRPSITNINGIVRWCGGEDVYLFNVGKGYYAEPLLKGTIRDLYLALPDKASILGVRDKHNAYRIRTYLVELKTEYVFSENGWVEEKKWHFPEIYRAGFRNRLYFLSLGAIYGEKLELDYSTIEDFIMTGEYVADAFLPEVPEEPEI